MMNSCAFPNQLHVFSFFDIICSVNVTEKKSQHARLRYRQIFELSNGLRKNRIIFSKSNRPCLLFCLPNFSIKVSSSRFRSGLLTNLHSDISTKCRILLLQISLFTVMNIIIYCDFMNIGSCSGYRVFPLFKCFVLVFGHT